MIDSHLHLSDERFNIDRDRVIENSINNGVKIFLEVLCSQKDWNKISLFKKYSKNFYFSVGIHPHYFRSYTDDDIKKLERLIKDDERIIGVGEIGVDLWYYPDSLKEQTELMLKQIEVANRNNKILVFHIRNSKNSTNAYDEFFNVTKNIIKVKSIIHSFSGNYDNAKKAIDRGFYIGINATITYPKNDSLREIIKKIGPSFIVTETDSPYLPPQRIRGKRNEPSNIKDIIKALSEILKLESFRIEEYIEKNFKTITQDLKHKPK